MANGIVKWFNDSKGFGFIEQEDGWLLKIDAPSVRGAIQRRA